MRDTSKKHCQCGVSIPKKNTLCIDCRGIYFMERDIAPQPKTLSPEYDWSQ